MQWEEDTHSYKGWLNSDHFLKRVFAVLGYLSVAILIAAIPVGFISIVIILISRGA